MAKKKPYTIIRLIVIPPGLEPGTYCLEGSCSIQLSYETGLLRFNINLIIYLAQWIPSFDKLIIPSLKLRNITSFAEASEHNLLR
jgi:hypothetical protein